MRKRDKATVKNRPRAAEPGQDTCLKGQYQETMRPRRIALIYNPHSNFWLNYARHGDTEGFLRQLLDPLDLDYRLIAFDPKALDDFSAQLETAGIDAMWVAGGDGTVLAFAPIARALDIPLGVIPAGTMNLLARDLHMDLNLENAVRQLLEADVHLIDMAEVNGHPFLCISNVGLTTRFTRLREQKRHQPGWIRWPAIAWKMFRALFDFPNIRIQIQADGKQWWVKTRAMSITNNPLCDSGGLFPSREALDSGELAVYVSHETSTFSMPRLIMRMMLGKWQDDPEMLVIHAEEVTLQMPRRRRVAVMSDGEILRLRTPLRYRIRARALKMLRPVPQTPEASPAETTQTSTKEATKEATQP